MLLDGRTLKLSEIQLTQSIMHLQACKNLNCCTHATFTFFSCNLINFSFCQEERINDEDEEWWVAVESTASQAELNHFNCAG